MHSKSIMLMMGLALAAEQCFSQKVPGLAYMDIMRTAPRRRVGGASNDPELPNSHIEPVANRRFDVMLDYDDDYFEYPDAIRNEEPVMTTLERPENREAILSTDITDYVLVSVDSSEEDDTSDLAELKIISEDESLPESNTSNERKKVQSFKIKKQTREQPSQESLEYAPALGTPLFLEEGRIISESSISSPLRRGKHLNEYAQEPYNLDLDYPYESDIVYPYSGDYPLYLSDNPIKSHTSQNLKNLAYVHGNFTKENTTYPYDSLDHMATSSQHYPSYIPNDYPENDYDVRDYTREYLKQTSALPTGYTDNSDGLVPLRKSNPSTTSHVTDILPETYSTVLSKRSNMQRRENVVRPVDRANREEIMYYTGLQREIEKSSLLSDAIRDVRSRDGKMVTFEDKKHTAYTTTAAPYPDARFIRNALGTHPLYRNLPGRSSSAKKKHEKYNSHRDYENEKDEYENMYLPARAKSLELSEIDEVRHYFNTLVPTTSYKSTDFTKYPSYPRQDIYLPPVTTYRPFKMHKYVENLQVSKIKSKPSSALPLEHRSKPEYTTKHSSSISKSKPYPAKYYRPQSSFSYTPKPSVLKYYTPREAHYPKPFSRYYIPITPSTHKEIESTTYKKRPKTLTSPYSERTKDYISTTTETQHTPFKPLKPFPPQRENSRQPSKSVYEEDSTLYRRPIIEDSARPIAEENVRQKRGPHMELAIDSQVSFPKFGYNIDRYFENFPSFGFFDYDPSKETY